MNRDKQNQEGYDDPTAYEAITNIEQEERALRAFRPIVYICSPYSGDVEHNVKAAQGYSRHAVDKGSAAGPARMESSAMPPKQPWSSTSGTEACL